MLRNGPAIELKPKDVNGCIKKIIGEKNAENKKEKNIEELKLKLEEYIAVSIKRIVKYSIILEIRLQFRKGVMRQLNIQCSE